MKPLIINTDILLDWDTPYIKRQRAEMLEFISDMSPIILYSDYKYQPTNLKHMKPIEDFHQLIIYNSGAKYIDYKHWRNGLLYRSMRIPVRREVNRIITIFYLVAPLNSITKSKSLHI